MIKDIIVHLDGSVDDAVKIAHSERVASLFGAHLRGLYTNVLPEIPLSMAELAAAATLITAYQSEARAQGDRIEQALARRFETLTVPAELSRVDVFASSLSDTVAGQARTADLFVALKPYGPDRPSSWPGVVEAALFASGRGVYIVPDVARTAHFTFETVLVAWNDTRESARALAEAMPFLQKAHEIVVVMMDRDGPAGEGEEPGAGIIRHLSRHGVKANLRHVRDWDRVSDALLSEVKKLGADLVVLGAYGHLRFREWILGGVTRDFLTRFPVPTLMAH